MTDGCRINGTLPDRSWYVRQLLSDLSEQGSWNGLDFTNSKAASWLPRIHAARVLELAKVYANSEHTFYKSAEIAEPFIRLWGIGSG